MLRSIRDIIGYRVNATDGLIGTVKDFYFHDDSWAICYMVLDTGHWLPGRQVLIAPQSLGEPDWSREVLPVNLTRQKIESSPEVDLAVPVSRQKQAELSEYFNWTPYWGSYAGPALAWIKTNVAEVAPRHDQRPDEHLRSVREVSHYRIHATDGEIGHVQDFIVQTDAWVLRYLVVDTRIWLPGKKVLVSPAWIERVDWPTAEVFVDLEQETIRNGPKFDYNTPVNREYEVRMYDYYGRPTYWD